MEALRGEVVLGMGDHMHAGGDGMEGKGAPGGRDCVSKSQVGKHVVPRSHVPTGAWRSGFIHLTQALRVGIICPGPSEVLGHRWGDPCSVLKGVLSILHTRHTLGAQQTLAAGQEWRNTLQLTYGSPEKKGKPQQAGEPSWGRQLWL